MKYEFALELFHQGQFRRLIDNFYRSHTIRDADTDLRILVGYVLALTDETTQSIALVDIDEPRLSPELRSQIEITRGIVSIRLGEITAASQHLHAGVKWARESNSRQQIACAHLHQFRFAIDRLPLDALKAMLRDVRTAVSNAGVPWLAAYLHVCVSVLEGQRGYLDEALRHCDIAESLLEGRPHPWVLGCSLVNRSCIAILKCELNAAAEYIRAAIQLTAVNGNNRQRQAAEMTTGYVHFLTGELDKAQRILTVAIADESTDVAHRLDAADTLARVYLAKGDLEKCSSTLEYLFSFASPASDISRYGKRCAATTRTKLLLRNGQFQEALKWLHELEPYARSAGDKPFSGVLHLLAAQALHSMERPTECARRIMKSDETGIRSMLDLQGQFHHSLGEMVSEHVGLQTQLRQRATRIWSTKGIVSVRLEIDEPNTSARANDIFRPTFADTRTVVNHLAAVFDLAHEPSLIATELLKAVEHSKCTSKAVVLETNRSASGNGEQRITFPVAPVRGGKHLLIECDIPATPSDAVLLSDILRIGRAALQLEEFREEERKQAAVWPSEPIEDQTGALYSAKEMQGLLDVARRVATTNIPVLITGETGTGKEVLARLIHSYSPRAAKTFLPFNCSATPRDMLDAQLFGHRRGAFTGATENFQGVIRAAAGGTLFLDEIGESTLDIQPKLLRFLESGEVHPIGETHPQRVDVRILAATNADVDALVTQGRFREDLFYRLNIIRLHLPPLRERRVEIPVFANHFLQKYAKEMHKGELRLAEETMDYLVLYRWPGNVRQIANEMRRLAALAENNAVLMPEHLSPDVAASRRTVPATDRTLEPSEIVVRIDQPLGAAIHHVEQTMIKSAMAKANSVDEAAKLLGLSRKGLYLKRLRFGLQVDRSKDDNVVA